MRFLPRRFTGPVWDCPSAVPSLHRITAACGPPTTLHAAQVFTSFYPPESKHMNDAHRALSRCSSLRAMTLCMRSIQGLPNRSAMVERITLLESANGMVRPCSGPASTRSWQGGAQDKEHAMSQKLNAAIAVIGIDIGKNSFHIVGHDHRGAIVLRQKWSRDQVETRLANLPPYLIGMEACRRASSQSQTPNAWP